MKNTLLNAALLLSLCLPITAQITKDYNPAIQKTTEMQFFKPSEKHLFAADCMPYFHNGTFYLYWLLDEGHHAGLGGLGGHQWALSTSKDLINWKHYPIALGIDEEWEKSICTGSVIVDKGDIYAFYSTRIFENDQKHEQLSYAISKDEGITFEKQQPNPFYTAPEECESSDFRDPKVFKDKEGKFHLFISGYLKNPVLSGFGGYLAHLVSDDLKNWKEAESPLGGQQGTPECCDYFYWNGWYYLIYGTGLDSYYVKSKNPYGPWEYPSSQALRESWSNVAKTAEFNGKRRISVSWMATKRNNKDNEGGVFGGNILFRELVQLKDGTLGTKFVEEVLPEKVLWGITPENKTIDARNGIDISSIKDLPENYRITMQVHPKGSYDELGLFLRATNKHEKGYKLEFNANKRLVNLYNTMIESVAGLDKPFTVDILVQGEFIDVSINNNRCIVNRLMEQKGKDLFFFVKNGMAEFKNIRVYELKTKY